MRPSPHHPLRALPAHNLALSRPLEVLLREPRHEVAALAPLEVAARAVKRAEIGLEEGEIDLRHVVGRVLSEAGKEVVLYLLLFGEGLGIDNPEGLFQLPHLESQTLGLGHDLVPVEPLLVLAKVSLDGALARDEPPQIPPRHAFEGCELDIVHVIQVVPHAQTDLHADQPVHLLGRGDVPEEDLLAVGARVDKAARTLIVV